MSSECGLKTGPFEGPDQKEEGAAETAPSKPLSSGLGSQTGRNVRENVLDLVAKKDKDDDDHDCDQNQDKGVLHHSLAFLVIAMGKLLAELQIKA
jgi:hypothetical protein